MMMKNLKQWLLVSMMMLGCLTEVALAQTLTQTPLNTVSLSVAVTETVPQDRVVVRMYTELNDVDSTRLTAQINQTLNRALNEAKQVPEVKSYTGSYRTWPVTDPNTNQITTWQGRGEIVLEASNFDAIAGLMSRLAQLNMQIGQLNFSLSNAKQSQLEQRLINAGLDSFRTRAQQITRQLGFKTYDLVEINVVTNSAMPYNTNYRLAQAPAKFSSDSVAPMALEAGDAEVTVQVNGSIRMK